jgi:hypothetical protein
MNQHEPNGLDGQSSAVEPEGQPRKASELRSWEQILALYGGDSAYQLGVHLRPRIRATRSRSTP